MYCGTRQGDIIEVNLPSGRYKKTGAIRKISTPVITINCFFNCIFIGYSNGIVAKIEKRNLTFESEYDIGMGNSI
jgi:hypothetical protein